MKKKIYIFIYLFVHPLFAQSSESEKIYQSVLNATFTEDKIEVAKSFLKKNECKEGFYILKLLKDSHYWNREAGIYLVGECKNFSLDRELCNVFIEDNMTRSSIRSLIKKDPSRFSKNLISIYKKDMLGQTKEELFEIYSLTKDEDTSNLLQGLINDSKSPDREIAFKALMKHPKKPGNSFFRSFLKDKDLRKITMQWIVENGNESDLDFFKEILANRKSSIEELVNAGMAIKKWGTSNDKKITYLRFLKEDNQSLLPVSFSIFDGFMDDDIFSEISRLSRAGKNQTIRTEAILQLKNSVGSKKYPYIILFLQEEYQSQDQHTGGDTFATVITFGLHGVFKGLQEKQRKEKFYSIQSELVKLLQKETGEKFSSVPEWKVWANQKKLLPVLIKYE